MQASWRKNRSSVWARARGLELTPENRPVWRATCAGRACSRLRRRCGRVLATLVELVLHGELVILGFHSDGSGAPYAGPSSLHRLPAGALRRGVACPRARSRPAAPPASSRASSTTTSRAACCSPSAGSARGALGLLSWAGPYPSPARIPTGRRSDRRRLFAAFAAGLERRALARAPAPAVHRPRAGGRRRRIRAQSVQALAGAGSPAAPPVSGVAPCLRRPTSPS